MSSEYPDTSFYYFKEDYDPVCKNAIVCFNFTKQSSNNKNWLDSLEHARLIFITGGDQLRFMNIVLNTPYTRPYMLHMKMEQQSGHQCRRCCDEQGL
jgi:cyanophycinase